MANIQTHGVGKLVQRAHAYARQHGVGKALKYSYGPWKVYGTTGGSASTYTFSLHHYSTEMLRWRYVPASGDITIEGTWTGWGSVSDQTGVNAALHALGSNLRYSRDTKGGGPRVNPRGRRNYTYARNAVTVSAGGRAINAISPATPYWMR